MKTATAAPAWETCCAEPHADEPAMLRDHLEHREREPPRSATRKAVIKGEEPVLLCAGHASMWTRKASR